MLRIYKCQCNLTRGKYKEFPYTLQGKPGKLRVNICDYFDVPQECKTEGIEKSSVMFISDKGDCVELLSEYKSENTYEVINKEKPLDGIKIQKKQNEFQVDLICNKDQEDPSYVVNDQNNLVITTSDACAQKNEIAEFIYKNRYIYSIILICVGIMFLTIGGSKWDSILTLVGFLVGCGGIWFIFWAFVKFQQSTLSYVIIGFLSIIVGILIASLCRTFTILSYFLLGFAGGFVLSQYLLIFFQFKGELWVYNLILIGCGCVIGALCTFAQKYVLALITAILGGLLVSFNFGFLIGALGNFYDIMDKIKNGDELRPAFYIFFVVFVFLSIIGFLFQVKQIKAEERDKQFIQSEHLLIQLILEKIFFLLNQFFNLQMNFKQQILDQLQSFEKEYHFIENFQNYYSRIFYLLLIVFAFYLGRYVVSNSLEQYLDYFQDLLQQQQKIKTRINIVLKLKKFFSYWQYIAPIIASSFFYLINKEDLHNRKLKFKEIFEILVQEKINQIITLILFGFLILNAIIACFIDKYIQWQKNKLKDIQGNKTIYVSKFFDYIGEDLKQQLREFLVGNTQNPNIQKLYKQIKNEQQQIKNLESCIEKQSQEIKIQQEFISQITSFDWCNVCFNDNKNIKNEDDQSQQQDETQKINQQCISNCLEKYLLLCENIAKNYFQKLKKINQFFNILFNLNLFLKIKIIF